MKTFAQFAAEIKKAIDQEDNAVLANIENSIELTSVATADHAVDSYFVYNKKIYQATSAIEVGDNLVAYPDAGYNMKLADDIMTIIANHTVTTDPAPTEGSTNPVQSGGVYTADANEASTRSAMGAKNLLRFKDDTYNNGGSITLVKGTSRTLDADIDNLAEGTYKLVFDVDTYSGISTSAGIRFLDANLQNIGSYNFTSAGKKEAIISLSGIATHFYCIIDSAEPNADATTTISHFMVCPPTDANTEYQPYSMTNQQLTPYALSQSNPNLLDNPWFTVNQRGETTYSSGSNRDTLDRWRAEAAIEVSIDSDNVVTLTTSSAAQFMQRIPLDDLKFLYGKTVTVSVMLSNGNVISNTFAIPSTLPAENTNYGAFDIGNSYDVYLRIYSSREFFAFCIHSVATTATISIKAVKLELGTVSTLALDTAPNYAEELLKCQRYFISYRVDVDNNRWIGGSGVTVGEHLCQIPIYLPVAMRVRPSISYSHIKGYFPYITGQVNSVAIATGELTVNRITGNIVILTYNTENQSGFTALTRGMGMFLWIDSDNDAHIDLSADL